MPDSARFLVSIGSPAGGTKCGSWWWPGRMALLMTACASPPAVDPAVLALDGNFAGPVVADLDVSDAAVYDGMCEDKAYRWDRGWYRVYRPCGRPAP